MPHTGNTSQQNAQHSTGPVTDAGKAASSKNSFRHGLTAAAMIMVNGERIEDFLDLANTFLAEHNPATITEETLVTQMINGVWLSKRAAYLQQDLIIGSQVPDEKKLALYMRYQAMHDRNFHKAHNELRRMRKEDRAELQKQVRVVAQKEASFVSQTGKQALLVAKVRQLNIRSEAGQVAVEHGKIRNSRLLTASVAAVSTIPSII